MTILQNARWQHILKQNVGQGSEQGLDSGFVEEVYKAIHQASIAAQRMVIRDELGKSCDPQEGRRQD